MVVVRDDARGVFATLAKCKRCGGQIYFGYSQRGRRVAFNAVEEQRDRWVATRDLHDGEACLVQQALNRLEGGA